MATKQVYGKYGTLAMRFALSSRNTESAKSISFGKGTEQ